MRYGANWGSTVVTEPLVEPVTLAKAKLHLRVITDNADEEAEITECIKAARIFCERLIRRKLINQTIRFRTDQFPNSRIIELPFPPLVSVSSVKYNDEAGDEQTLSSDRYYINTDYEPGRVVLKSTAEWPTTNLNEGSVNVTYVAGYGTSADDVPLDIRRAMLLIIGHLYENREQVVIGTISSEIPFDMETILSRYIVGHV